MSAHPAEGITRAGETSAAALLPSTPGTQHVALQEGQGWLWKRKEDELQGHVCVTSRAGQSHRAVCGSSRDGVAGTGRARVRGTKGWRG